jgi:DNA-binding transcriptional MerR regulator
MKRQPKKQMTDAEQARLPKYTIGVVAQLLNLPPQVLRRYEEAGLLEPARQAGKNRLYSDYDIEILEEIAELSDQGVNAVGIRHILQMRREVYTLRQEVKEAREAQYVAEQRYLQIEITQKRSISSTHTTGSSDEATPANTNDTA